MKKALITALLMVATFTSFAVIAPAHSYAEDPANCRRSIAILPTWYKYLDFDKNCDVVVAPGEGAKTAVLVGLAIIEMLLVVAGVIAVIMVMIGGFKYVISQGEPEKIGNAKMTIINALLGAVIAIIASQVVAYLAGAFGGSGPGGLIQANADAGNLRKALDIFFVIIGAISVFMIVLSGFNFVTSGGDSEKVKKARRTIYYSVIGLIVAIFASVIVSFVLGGVT